MQGLSNLLMAAGGVVALVGAIIFLIAAFRQSVIWGLGCLCFSPVQLVFLILHWHEAKKGFLIELVGIGLSVLGVIIAPDGGARLRGYLAGLGLG